MSSVPAWYCGVEGVVAAPERGFVDPAEADDELAPGVVGIDRQQRVVEVEEAEVVGPHWRSSAASMSRTSGFAPAET